MKTVFYGGKIITMAEPLYAEAVLVENGSILAVGSEAELRPMAETFVDLAGKTLLPGFVDAHGHLTEYATASLQVNLNGMANFTDIQNAVRQHIAEKNIPAGEWVVARNYEHNLFSDARILTMEEIDSIAPDHLLLIKHTSCHMGLVNSRVFEKFGITAQTPSPYGGKYVVENGKLTGCVEESACTAMRMRVPAPTLEKACEAHVKMQDHYASYGITTAQDGYLGSNMMEIYRWLIENDALKLDLIPYAHIPHYERLMKLFHTLPKSPHLHLGGVKQFLDGSLPVRTAWLKQPYLGDDGAYCGHPNQPDEVIVNAFKRAAELNEQIIFHSNGDAANEQFLRCLATAQEEYPKLKEMRPTLIHAQLWDEDMLQRAAQLGAVVSFFVAHIYYWGDTHIRNLGIERASRISPARTALSCGVHFNFHQDAPVIEPNMLETVWCAVNRITRNGVHLAGEEISVLDALRAVTVNAAYQYFEEDKKGTIEAGKYADFVVLDRDPLAVPKEQIRDIQVLQTYKNGTCIYSKDR